MLTTKLFDSPCSRPRRLIEYDCAGKTIVDKLSKTGNNHLTLNAGSIQAKKKKQLCFLESFFANSLQRMY
jgi:hypothetical protein